MVNDADWAAVESEVSTFGGEQLVVELTPEAEKEIAALSEDDKVVEAFRKRLRLAKVSKEH